MKATLLLATLMASAAALAATPAAKPAAQPVAKAMANPDGQIAAIVMTANDAEIAAGKGAMEKAKSPDVKAFAKHMVEEHTNNNAQQAELAKTLGVKAEESPKVANLKKDAARIMGEVNTHSGAAFDKAYMESQVAMHEQVLSSIERELVPMSQNAQMKTFLETTKSHVSQHLEQAKKILSKL